MKKISTPRNMAAESPPMTPPTVAAELFPGFGLLVEDASKGDPLLPDALVDAPGGFCPITPLEVTAGFDPPDVARGRDGPLWYVSKVVG
jgi:hypothetical protein